MASATRADLLHALPLAIRSRGEGGLTTAADLRDFLAAVLTTDGGAAPAPLALLVPQLQIRSFSGARGEVAATPKAGRLASASGASTAAAGPFSTPNYLRLSFGPPLPAAVLAAHPELWLFTYHNRRRRPAQAGGLLRQAGWGYPCPAEVRRHGAFWGGANVYGAATEFYGPAVAQGLALAHPDSIIDANHWFQSARRPTSRRAPTARKGGCGASASSSSSMCRPGRPRPRASASARSATRCGWASNRSLTSTAAPSTRRSTTTSTTNFSTNR